MISELIYKLCNTFSGSGCEDNIATLIKEEMLKYSDRVIIDKNRNVICNIGNESSKRHILIDAHIDQISMVVTGIDKSGFINIAACGGIDCRVLPGSTVYIHGKEVITGIVCTIPPHLSADKAKTFAKTEDLIVDTGLSGQETNKIISVGDYVTFSSKPQKLIGNKITSLALDNRAGITALIKCAKILRDEKLDCLVTFLFSTQEETHMLGAKTASFSINPTEAITVDVSFATQPKVRETKCGIMSHGPMIGIAPYLSRKMSTELINLAKNNNIPYQIEVMSPTTGTTADVITESKGGIQGCTLSIPLRYMHTAVEVVDLEDINQTAKLLLLYILNGGKNNNA